MRKYVDLAGMLLDRGLDIAQKPCGSWCLPEWWGWVQVSDSFSGAQQWATTYCCNAHQDPAASLRFSSGNPRAGVCKGAEHCLSWKWDCSQPLPQHRKAFHTQSAIYTRSLACFCPKHSQEQKIWQGLPEGFTCSLPKNTHLRLLMIRGGSPPMGHSGESFTSE